MNDVNPTQTAEQDAPGPEILAAFDLGPGAPAPTVLVGGSRPVYRVEDVVLKRLYETALENSRSIDLFPWLAETLSAVPDGTERGFRLAKPLRTRTGAWLAPGGWTAWTFVEGTPAAGRDVPACLAAIRALHAALRHAPMHPLLDRNETKFGRADRDCWAERPPEVHPFVAPLVDALYARRRPLPPLAEQLIHADLNPSNILVAPGLPPAFLDVTPSWRPADFALAMFANWIGPRQGDPSVLRHFRGVPHFEQLLVRAAIRMLLIMGGFEDRHEWEAGHDKRAAELVLELAGGPADGADDGRGGTRQAQWTSKKENHRERALLRRRRAVPRGVGKGAAPVPGRPDAARSRPVVLLRRVARGRGRWRSTGDVGS